MTPRWALSGLSAPVVWAALLATAATATLVVAPQTAFALVIVVFAALALPHLRAEHLIAALILYLPFENQVLTYSPQGLTPFIRYAPEALVDLAILLVVFGNLDRLFERMGKLKRPLTFLLVTWAASALWAGVAATTAFIGMRSELRFLPLLLLALLSKKPAKDAMMYGRAIVIAAVLEATVIFAQAIGGAAVRGPLEPKWSIEINGVAFANSGFNKPDTNFGTFSNYNAAGTFLVFAWIILASAGGRRLGLPGKLGLVFGSAIAGATIVSGSRESGLALVIAGIFIAHVRFRRWVPTAMVLASVAAILVGPWVLAAHYGVPTGAVNGRHLVDRWAYVMSPKAWSTDYHDNFRLFLLRENAQLVADTSPGLGFGIGSVSDKRTIIDGTNPLYRTWAGRRALAFSYIYDGQWGLLLMEVGFLGLAALALFFFAVFRTGRELMRYHWLGTALVAQVVAVFVLGFFATVLQLRLPTAILWLTTGLALAMLSELRKKGPEAVLGSASRTV